MNYCAWCKAPLSSDIRLINGKGFCSPRCESEYERARRDGTLPNEGCFITTAVCRALDKSDDCIELITLRNFRDSYMKTSQVMQGEVKKYYNIAPKICNEIGNEDDFGANTYSNIWEKYIKYALDAIARDDKQQAYDIYKNMVLSLEQKYLTEF